MTETSYPFAPPASAGNPAGVVGTDEKYRRMARWWRTDGVVESSGGNLQLRPAASGLGVTIDTGAGFVGGVYYENTAAVTLPLAAAHATLSRFDLVVLRLNPVAKAVTAAVVTGTPGGGLPTPSRTDAAFDVPIGHVLIPAATASVAPGNLWQPGNRWSPAPVSTADPAWQLGLATGTAVPRGSVTRLPLVDHGTFSNPGAAPVAGLGGVGVTVLTAATTSGVTILRRGVYLVSVQGRLSPTTSVARDGQETVFVEQQRAGVRVTRVGGPPDTLSSTLLLQCEAGDVLIPLAFQSHSQGTWRVDDTRRECRFTGVWLRD